MERKGAELGTLSNIPRAYVFFIVLSALLLPAKLANALSLSEYHKDSVSTSCPAATWNIMYKTCRAPTCGSEQYGEHIRDKLCSTPECGEESRTPGTYTSCRNLDNDIDDSRIIAAMNSGNAIDRAAALLAQAIKETQNLQIAVRDEIEILLNDITLDSTTAKEKIDALRALLKKKGSATTVDDVRETWAKA